MLAESLGPPRKNLPKALHKKLSSINYNFKVKTEPASPGSNFKVSSPSSTYSSSVGSPQMAATSNLNLSSPPNVMLPSHSRSRSAPVQPVIPARTKPLNQPESFKMA